MHADDKKEVTIDVTHWMKKTCQKLRLKTF